MRRVDCLSYGVRVELVPWAEGRNHLTKSHVRAQAQPGPVCSDMWKAYLRVVAKKAAQ